MAERDYTPDEARKLEEKYQAGTMAPENRPVWEQRRAKYQQYLTPLPGEGGRPALERVEQQPQPPAAMQPLPPPPAKPEAPPQPQWRVSLTDPAPGAKALPPGVDPTTITGPRSYLEQVGRLLQHAATTEAEGMREHPEVWQVGSEIVATTLLSQVPGGQAVAAARYARMAPAARRAYWVAKEVLQPLLRYGVIGAGTGAVPLLFGKPMSEAIQTALFTAIGESVGGGEEKVRAKVTDILRHAVKESPEGALAGETLQRVGQEGTLGMRTGSERAKRLETALRESAFGGRLRSTYEKSIQAMSDEMHRVEQRLSTRDIRGNPDVLVQESIQVAKTVLDEQAAERFGGVDLMIARRQRPDTGTYPRPPREPLGPERVQWDIDPTTGRIGMKAEATGQVPATARPTPPPGVQPIDRVSLASVKQMAAALLAQTKKTGVPTKEGEALLMAMLNHPSDSLSFREAHQLLSNWLKVSRSTDELISGQAHGFASKLSSALYQELDKTARANGADVHEAWKATREWYKGAIQRFDNPITQRLMQAAPDEVVSLIAKDASPVAIKTARDAINNPLLWDKIGQTWLERTLAGVSHPRTQVISADQLLQRLKDFGTDALRELFPGGQGREMYKLAMALSQIQRGGGAAPWNRVIHLAEGGGIALALSYGEVPYHMSHWRWEQEYGAREQEPSRRMRWPYYAAGTVLALTPYMLTRILASPKLTRALLEGTQATTDPRRRMEIAGGILGLLSEEGLLRGEAMPAPAAAPPALSGAR